MLGFYKSHTCREHLYVKNVPEYVIRDSNIKLGDL